jgi:hypothetical protein
VEIERARISMRLSKIREAEGNIDGFAKTKKKQ